MSCKICIELQEMCQECTQPKRCCRKCGRETPKALYFKCTICYDIEMRNIQRVKEYEYGKEPLLQHFSR